MNDLVFVMYNLKLQERKLKRQRERKAELDDLAFDDLPSDDEWITKKENPALPKKGNWLGVFDEGEDCNTDDEEEIDEVEFITSQLRKSYNDGPSSSSGKRKIGTKNVVEIDEDKEEGEGESEEEFEDDHDKYQNFDPNDATNEWGYLSEDYTNLDKNVGGEVKQGDEEDEEEEEEEEGDDFDYYQTPFVSGDDEQGDGSDGDSFYD